MAHGFITRRGDYGEKEFKLLGTISIAATAMVGTLALGRPLSDFAELRITGTAAGGYISNPSTNDGTGGQLQTVGVGINICSGAVTQIGSSSLVVSSMTYTQTQPTNPRSVWFQCILFYDLAGVDKHLSFTYSGDTSASVSDIVLTPTATSITCGYTGTYANFSQHLAKGVTTLNIYGKLK